MLDRRDALRMAKRFRTCPPYHVKQDERGSKKHLDAHMRICQSCTDEGIPLDAWRRLCEGLKVLFETSSMNHAVPAATGQVRHIKREKAAWRKSKFYSPPVVVVVGPAETDTGENSIFVAQIYHDMSMAGPGDLIVQYPGASDHAFFIETWNIYPLNASDLGPVFFSISPATMAAVNQLRKDQNSLAPGFPVPFPLHANDPRLEFREMETEIAQIFSSRAYNPSAAPGAIGKWAYTSIAEVMDSVKTIMPEARWLCPPGSVLEALVLVKIPDNMIPLAASDDKEIPNFAPLYMRHGGHIVSLSPLSFTIYGDAGIENMRAISGRIRGGTQELSGTDLICLYVTQDGDRISPSRVAWNDETGEFYIECPYEVSNDNCGAISLALFKEADGV